jgi:hypothetical protein
MPFALYEYNDAVEWRSRIAMEALLGVVEPALRAFRVIEVEAVPTTHVPIDGDRSIDLAPTHLEQTVSFDAECVQRAVDGDLAAVHRALLAGARWLACARVAHMKRALDTITEAIGQVARVGQEMTWESIMTAVKNLPIGFDAGGSPTFELWPPQAQLRYEALPARDADQERRWRQLMHDKREEARARERDRRLR